MGFTFAHCNAEIYKDRSARGDHDICRFDVAVNNPRSVHSIHSVNQLFSQPGEILPDVRPVVAHIIAQIEPIDKLRNNKCKGIIQFHINDLAYSRMVDTLQRQAFPTEPFAGSRAFARFCRARVPGIFFGKGIPEDLHSVDLAAVVLYAPYCPHSPAAKPGYERIPADDIPGFKVQSIHIRHNGSILGFTSDRPAPARAAEAPNPLRSGIPAMFAYL